MPNPFDVEFNPIQDFSHMLKESKSLEAPRRSPQSALADQIQNDEVVNPLGSPNALPSPASSLSRLHWSQFDRPEIGVMTANETARFAAAIGLEESGLAESASQEIEHGIYPRITRNSGMGPEDSIELAAQFDAVAAISWNVEGEDVPAPYTQVCSGILIAPDVLLSASHCDIAQFLDPEEDTEGAITNILFGTDANNPTFLTTAQHAIDVDETSEPFLLNGADVSLIFLSESVPSSVATPMRLTDLTHELVGMTAAMVGYGFYGPPGEVDNEYWQGDVFRSAGLNVIDSYGTPALEEGANIFSTDFDNGSQVANTIPGSSPNPIELESTTSEGDSGGPLLVKIDDEWLIAGVTSGGSTFESTYGDVSWFSGTAVYQDLIESYGGEFADESSIPSDDHSGSRSNASTIVNFTGTTNIGSFPIGRVEGAVEEAGDVDVFRFDILRDSRLIVDAIAVGNFDPFLKLYSSNGTLIRQNDNKANSLDSQIITNVDAGTYFAEVRSNNPSDTGTYKFAARHNGAPDDFGGKFSLAGTISLKNEENTIVRGKVETGDDRDIWQFVADRTGDLVVRASAKSGDLNTVIRVHDADKNVIASNNNWNGSLDSRLKLGIQSGERYFVSLNSVRETEGDYRLKLIPKINGEDNGRSANVDLSMPSAFGNGISLSLNQIGPATASQLATSTDLKQLTQFGPQPLGVLGAT